MFGIVDCNNFYASCERVFNPKLENKPVVILSNNDGCIIARSNEAKALGIPMGAPVFKFNDILIANKVNVFSSNYALYGDMSERVMTTIASFVGDIEIYSIDECFLDFTGYQYLKLPAFASELKTNVKKHTGIPISIGIAPTKTLAKVANRASKKSSELNGVCILDNTTKIENILKTFPIEDVWGIGRKYAIFLKSNNINTAYELTQANNYWIKQHLKTVGLRTVQELRGIPCNDLELEPNDKKTVCTARSFGKSLTNFVTVAEALANYASVCTEKIRKQKSATNCVTVFLKTNRYRASEPQYYQIKSMELNVATNNTPKIIECSHELLKNIWKQGYNYSKCGIILSNLIPENNVQQSLFDNGDTVSNKITMNLLDIINKRHGKNTLKLATQGFKQEWKAKQDNLSKKYTTDWKEILKINI
ncbi:MAG: Y-family DNA polymerase [Bacteroidia bacterium]|nr:Y-family DNA polymerase [Bacteroidia bacterium]